MNYRHIAADQFLQILSAVFAVVCCFQGISTKQLRQSLCIDFVGSSVGSGYLTRIAYDDLCCVRADKIIEPFSLAAFFKGYMQSSSLTSEKIFDCGGFGFYNRLCQNLSITVSYGNNSRCHMYVHADILCMIHCALLWWFGFVWCKYLITGGAFLHDDVFPLDAGIWGGAPKSFSTKIKKRNRILP